MNKKVAILGVIALVAAVIALGGGQALAVTLVVDDDSAECPSPFSTTIQDAVNAAGDGDTIEVCAGTYEEQVVIDGFTGLTLVAASTPTVQPPVNAKGAIIWVKNSTDVTIDGFKVDGAEHFASGCRSGDDRMFGIYYLNSSGTIKNNEVTRIRHTPIDGCQEGLGIYAKDDNNDGVTSQVEIANNTVTDYQKNGITCNVTGTECTILDNVVTGSGPGVPIAQNGIQVGFGASFDKIEGNFVTDHIYTQSASKGWVATGILIYKADIPLTGKAGIGQVQSSLERNNTVRRNQANVTVIP